MTHSKTNRNSILFLAISIFSLSILFGCDLFGVKNSNSRQQESVTITFPDTPISIIPAEKKEVFADIAVEVPVGSKGGVGSKALSGMTVIAKSFDSTTRLQQGTNRTLTENPPGTYTGSVSLGFLPITSTNVYIHIYATINGKVEYQGTVQKSIVMNGETPTIPGGIQVSMLSSYSVGDLGPGGGYIVAADAANKVYTEVAPDRWNGSSGDPHTYTWSKNTSTVGTSIDARTGVANVNSIKAVNNDTWTQMSGVSIFSAGSGYAQNDLLTLSGGDGNGKVTVTGITTGIVTVQLASGSSSKGKYVANDILTLTSSTNGGTTGSGGTVQVLSAASNGNISSILTTAISAGSGYTANRIYNTTGGGGTGATITVNTINAGINAISIQTAGTDYPVTTTAPYYATSGGTGSGATISVDTVNSFTNAISRFRSALSYNSLSDWTFPSKADLEAVQTQYAAGKLSGAGFTGGTVYWSSSEASTTNTYTQEIGGSVGSAAKTTNNLYIRPVRYF